MEPLHLVFDGVMQMLVIGDALGRISEMQMIIMAMNFILE